MYLSKLFLFQNWFNNQRCKQRKDDAQKVNPTPTQSNQINFNLKSRCSYCKEMRSTRNIKYHEIRCQFYLKFVTKDLACKLCHQEFNYRKAVYSHLSKNHDKEMNELRTQLHRQYNGNPNCCAHGKFSFQGFQALVYIILRPIWLILKYLIGGPLRKMTLKLNFAKKVPKMFEISNWNCHVHFTLS